MDEHTLIKWARAWFAAQLAKGRTFEDIRREFNAASPLLVSLFDAMDATERDETPAIVEAITRAYRQAYALADD